MGFSVPAISCMLSLPSNTSLFYLKMINGVAINVYPPAAAPLHHCNELCAPCVTGRSDVCCAASSTTHKRLLYDTGRTQRYPWLVLEAREGNEHEIILYPAGWCHAAASKLISNYPQTLWVSCKGVRRELSWHNAEQRETAHFTLPPFW